MESRKHKISGIVTAFNEEAIIRRCLRSLSWVDELILVDSHSTDRTVAIGKELGCRIITET